MLTPETAGADDAGVGCAGLVQPVATDTSPAVRPIASSRFITCRRGPPEASSIYSSLVNLNVVGFAMGPFGAVFCTIASVSLPSNLTARLNARKGKRPGVARPGAIMPPVLGLPQAPCPRSLGWLASLRRV